MEVSRRKTALFSISIEYLLSCSSTLYKAYRILKATNNQSPQEAIDLNIRGLIIAKIRGSTAVPPFLKFAKQSYTPTNYNDLSQNW